jgi:hypothetical protein
LFALAGARLCLPLRLSVSFVKERADMIGHNSGDLESIATDLNAELAEDVASILRKGRKFIEAKGRLGHGHYMRLFASHKDPLPQPVRCSARYAQQFIAIAENAVLTDANNSSHLPPTVDVLYALSRIDASGLAVAFHEGWVFPEMTRKDVKELRVRLGIDDEPPPKSEEDLASDFIARTKTHARKLIEAMQETKRHEFLFLMDAIAHELRHEVEIMKGAGE